MRHTGFLLLAAVLAVHADVTVRYRNDSKLLPAAMAERTIQIQGSRAHFDLSSLAALVDFIKQEITVFDTGRKTFATIPLSQYHARMKAAMPAAAANAMAMFDAAKTKVTSAPTGHTETILGLAADEKALEVVLKIPGTGGEMKMHMRIWTAKPAEFLSKPELRELAAFGQWQQNFMELGDMAPGLNGALAEVYKSGVILRTHVEVEIAMPGGPGAAPMMEMTEQVVEISTAALDASVFHVPEAFTAAPFEDLVKASIESMASGRTAGTPKVRADGVKAYVPSLVPLEQGEPVVPEGSHGMVELLLTIDRQGAVGNVEVLAGPQALRQPAINAVKKWGYRPVLRDGAPVFALTDATIDVNADASDIAGVMAATDRRTQLEQEFPRSPQRVLADLEQDSGGGDGMRRYYALDHMAQAALHAGALDKAATYAGELLNGAKDPAQDWNYGNATHDGNMVLGLVALRQGDVSKAGNLLLEAGRTPGSPQLDSFGPDMTLAKELLAKGEAGIVLKYLSLCGNFWKMGTAQLESWSKTIRDGGTPNFGK